MYFIFISFYKYKLSILVYVFQFLIIYFVNAFNPTTLVPFSIYSNNTPPPVDMYISELAPTFLNILAVSPLVKELKEENKKLKIEREEILIMCQKLDKEVQRLVDEINEPSELDDK